MLEILSPAGNYKAFLGAVNAGCDAVYLGGTKYGARAYADNFTDEEIINAITYAHTFNVKVYLTVNTLIKGQEFEPVCEYIRQFYEAGLDACIVQDMGLIRIFKEQFPKMECHISTQGFATDINSVRLYKSLGASRVVLARELSLEEIRYIKENVDIEIETFIHGAMCYSYSGQCLMSSCLGGRSGNRGRCAGPCRLPVKVKAGNNTSKEAYYLSMKDQCTLEILPKLIEAGIDSLKIEGRMKSPEYTAFVTSMYRKYVDLYLEAKDDYRVDIKDMEDLRHIYLRSEIGTGYYNIYNGSSMLTLNNPAYSGNDDELIEDIKKQLLEDKVKLPVDISCEVSVKAPLSVTIMNDKDSVTVYGNDVQYSLNRPITEGDIIKQLSKLGDTPFYANSVSVNLQGDCFVSVKELNELRRMAVKALLDKSVFLTDDSGNKNNFSVKRNKKDVNRPLIFVSSKEQFTVADSKATNCILALSSKLAVTEDFSSTNNTVIVDLPHVIRKKDVKYLEHLFSIGCNKANGFVYHNLSELSFLLDKDYEGIMISGPENYAWNKSSSDFFDTLSDALIAPYELTHPEIRDIDYPFKEVVYGRIPLMHTANCVYKSSYKCEKNSGPEFVEIIDRKNVRFPVKRDCNVCENIIYNSVPTLLHEEVLLGKIKKNRSVLVFTNESAKETERILNIIFNAFDGKKTDIKGMEYTKGYRKRGVE